MNSQSFIRKFSVHILMLVVLLGLAFAYAYPIFKGKNLAQHDLVQAAGAAEEISNFEKQTGKVPLWTNSMFGGMPAYTIKGDYPNSFTSKIASFISYQMLPAPVNLIFLLLAGFYLMLAVLNFNPWISLIGAIAYAFTSYNLIIIEAGHASKVVALAYAPVLLGGIILLYKNKYWQGTLITSIGMILELYANHIQITYYLVIAVIFFVIYKLYLAIRDKRLKDFLIPSVIALLIGVLSIGSMASRFWTTYEYTNFSIRGPAVLKSQQSKGGLDKDYAFSWSYGVAETFTFLVPDFYGGSSTGELSEKSDTYETLIRYNLPASTAKDFVKNVGGYGGQLYWGTQPSTSGPAYLGAVSMFLFVLAFFIVKDRVKYVLLAVVVLFTMMSWGKNFELLTDFLFDNAPLYNKFRAVTMIHGVVAILTALMAAWALKVLYNENWDSVEAEKGLKLSTIGVGGLLLIFIVFGSAFLDFQKEPETMAGQPEAQTADQRFQSILEQMTGNKVMAQDIYSSFVSDRASLFRKDSIRSLIFVLLSAAIVWAYIKKKLTKEYMLAGFTILMFADLWFVDKRYLNDADFQKVQNPGNSITPSSADIEILKDKDPNFRVMNTVVGAFNDATNSYFHKSIGGYSGAKFRRYQDLIERQLGSGNMRVYNMLNTKYFIVKGRNGELIAQRNPDALGNSWFVDSVKWVNTADEEMNALSEIDPGKTVVINSQYKGSLGDFQPVADSASVIKLTKYIPDELIYESNSNSDEFAVFSEIFYGDKSGWEAYIDDKPVSHVQVNYLLRGMLIPKGKHTIRFEFKPQSYYKGETISLICSVILLGLIIGTAYMSGKESND